VQALVKKIVVGQGGLKVFLDIGLVDLIQKIASLNLSPEVRNEKNTWNTISFAVCDNFNNRLFKGEGTAS
jgi:hypothetical protein